MNFKTVTVFCIILNDVYSLDFKFPPGFKFGAASSAYQIEGAWNVSGKGVSAWDRFTHEMPGSISDGTNGDIASDSYHQWKRDVEISSELGLHFYRFSIAWTRILPTGFDNYVSENGTKYYNRLIDELLAHGVEPLITMYHCDLPQKLQDLGGWTNPLVTEWFESYAKVVFSLFADRVKTWITINEPLMSCDMAYNTGVFAPGIVDTTHASYLCSKHVLIAHAKAWRIYDEQYKSKYRGRVSIANQYIWFEPLTQDPQDEELAELANELMSGLVTHPIYSKEGGWPPKIQKLIDDNSRREGYSRSRLPKFTLEEIELVKGTYDYIAFNYYTSRVVTAAVPGEVIGFWPSDRLHRETGARTDKRESWQMGYSALLPIYAEGLRKVIAWFRRQYGDVNFIITENGYSTFGTNLNDDDRIQYFKEHMEQLLIAIEVDGANITGYTVWTLIDNFEWMDGYRTKFGLYEVDFNDPNRKRTARKSALFYTSVIKNHSLLVPDIPDFYINTNRSNNYKCNLIVICTLLFVLMF